MLEILNNEKRIRIRQKGIGQLAFRGTAVFREHFLGTPQNFPLIITFFHNFKCLNFNLYLNYDFAVFAPT